MPAADAARQEVRVGFRRRRWQVIASIVTVCVTVGCAGSKKPEQTETLNPAAVEAARQVRFAEAYLQAGRINEAFDAMEKAVRAQPDRASVWNLRGQVCLIAGRYPEAEESLKKALALDPHLTDVHNNLGALYDRIGRKDEAERELKLALMDVTYPTPEKAWLNLGLLYASQGRNDEAIRALRKAVESRPKYYQAHYELASMLDKTGRLEEAVREFEVAGPAYQGNADYHYRLGFGYFRLGDKAKAQEHLRRVIELTPGSENSVKADELLKAMR
jgi:type IV pilus assembly protein PilF